MIETLADLLSRVLREHYNGVKSDMAKAIQMTPSPLGKAIDGSSRYFGAEACLRLAKVTGEPASRVLETAGKSELASLIEGLYGHQTLAANERELLDDWRTIPAEQRENLRRVVRDTAAACSRTIESGDEQTQTRLTSKPRRFRKSSGPSKG